MAVPQTEPYPARLDVDYPDRELDRVSSFFRIIWIIPIAIVLAALSSTGSWTYVNQAGETVSESGGGIVGGLFLATLLMIVVRQKYPRWWFDFAVELERFSTRVGAYFAFMNDEYPSTTDQQSVHLDFDYPDVEQDLNRWMPLVKWLLLIPHYIVLAFLFIGALFAWIITWFAILFTGKYPRAIFDYLVGVGRWATRVYAYGFMLITDRYPPFSLQ
ncbi:MAG: DUF4389 domain-containing protein [Acidimicrobiia bacterium]|nr:DUF4389 domain-containing protein [Acidimicrobiia bacterium]